MAALHFGGIHASCNTCPFPTIKTKCWRLSTSYTSADCIAVIESCKRFNGNQLTKHMTSSIQSHRFLVKTRSYTLKATAFQAVDGHDSEGSDISAPSAKYSNLMSEFQRQKLRGLLLSSSKSLQGYARTLSKPAISKVFENFTKGVESKLRTLRTRKLISTIQLSEASIKWKQMEPWIRWPITIFAVLCLMTMLIFGVDVTLELIPLWIMGPLTVGFCMKSTYDTVKFTHKILAKTSGHRSLIRERSFQLYQDARLGKLSAKITAAGACKLNKFKMVIETKKEWLIIYVKSGQAYPDFLILLRHLGSRAYENYEDWEEWSRPYRRRFARLLRKVF